MSRLVALGCGPVPALMVLLAATAALAAGDAIVAVRLSSPLTSIRAGGSVPLEIHLEVKRGWHVYPEHPTTRELEPLGFKLEGPAGTVFTPLDLPPGEMTEVAAFGKSIPLYEGRVVVRSTATLPADLARASPGRFKVTVHYQACSDMVCRMPTDVEAALALPVETEPTTTGATAAPSVAATPTPVPSERPSPPGEPSPAPAPGGSAAPTAGPTRDPGPGSTRSTNVVQGWLDQHGMVLMLCFVFVSGLGLNLTPCIYPMIPITISFFGGQASGRLGRSFVLAASFVLGMAITYSTMGVVAALLGAMLGAALQSPVVLVLISVTFVVLALSMFGLFELRPPAFVADRFGAREGVLGAVLMGLLVGFVAAPCVGPIVAALLTFVAERGSVLLGFLIFFTLSLGLGLPYLVLGTFSGMISALPSSGAWMDSVKRFFGLILLLMALYYLRGLVAPAVVSGLAGAVLVVAGIAAGAMEPIPGWAVPESETAWWAGSVRKSFGLAAVVAGGGLLYGALSSAGLFGGDEAARASDPARGTSGIRWTVDAGLLDGSAAHGRPIMVDFYSKVWCPACIELDRNTYPDPQVVAQSRRFTNVKIDVDIHPRAKELIRRFSVQGIPTILFMDSGGREEPSLRITGFVPPAEMVRRMQMVK
ncbi:MAG: thioredoxin fold domain-containing protein [Candidatus Riflebacteria bacterium]|nr:thioredoxin fold domain-containing protein [Candidatus Riflebacteria bacterium]